MHSIFSTSALEPLYNIIPQEIKHFISNMIKDLVHGEGIGLEEQLKQHEQYCINAKTSLDKLKQLESSLQISRTYRLMPGSSSERCTFRRKARDRCTKITQNAIQILEVEQVEIIKYVLHLLIVYTANEKALAYTWTNEDLKKSCYDMMAFHLEQIDIRDWPIDWLLYQYEIYRDIINFYIYIKDYKKSEIILLKIRQDHLTDIDQLSMASILCLHAEEQLELDEWENTICSLDAAIKKYSMLHLANINKNTYREYIHYLCDLFIYEFQPKLPEQYFKCEKIFKIYTELRSLMNLAAGFLEDDEIPNKVTILDGFCREFNKQYYLDDAQATSLGITVQAGENRSDHRLGNYFFSPPGGILISHFETDTENKSL